MDSGLNIPQVKALSIESPQIDYLYFALGCALFQRNICILQRKNWKMSILLWAGEEPIIIGLTLGTDLSEVHIQMSFKS